MMSLGDRVSHCQNVMEAMILELEEEAETQQDEDIERKILREINHLSSILDDFKYDINRSVLSIENQVLK